MAFVNFAAIVCSAGATIVEHVTFCQRRHQQHAPGLFRTFQPHQKEDSPINVLSIKLFHHADKNLSTYNNFSIVLTHPSSLVDSYVNCERVVGRQHGRDGRGGVSHADAVRDTPCRHRHRGEDLKKG